MSDALDPDPLFRLLAYHLPEELRSHVLVVGSLAAAYHFRERLTDHAVNTKDADIVIHPVGALDECTRIAHRLLSAQWHPSERCRPQPSPEPHDALEAIRLHPPGSDAYFVELLALPEVTQHEPKAWIPVKLDDGWYGLPSFRFMGLTSEHRLPGPGGLSYAHPAMMALSNLLAHPRVGTARMSAAIGGRRLLRAAKDLGRVLGLAWYAGRDETETVWLDLWRRAIPHHLVGDRAALLAGLGDGLRELLEDPASLDEATHALADGLLRGHSVSAEGLAIVGRRLLQDVIVPVEALASR